MTTTAAIAWMVLAIAFAVCAVVAAYRLDVAHEKMKRLRQDIADMRAVLDFTRQTRDNFADSVHSLERENATLRRALESEKWFGTPHVEGTQLAGGGTDAT